MSDLKEAIAVVDKMEAISLKEMDRVSLMDRVDTKFYFDEEYLAPILESIRQYYHVLEIEGIRIMPYESVYYDTADRQMLRWHQNGKLNRYKIRRRKYMLTGQDFLEIKFKSNKGNTEKTRRLYNVNTEKDKKFILENTPFSMNDLEHVLNNSFQRIMLVNRISAERVTIDLNVSFGESDNDEMTKLEKLVVLEVKSERSGGMSEIQRKLKEFHIYPNGFSKFITGMYIFHKDLKFNRFKRRFSMISKTMGTDSL
ncbi:polyphosphate polymerase domain-containing protein [Lentimicrobium sp. L6]|uniref:polyphosphate polymerase domain-containing protein n=1 Tax=Lentimicrobium sp. L6 TaxID=2735916 RepID=UPI001552445F|nr:polyphosphate polymerase domain-containing protein [Lentimicrobium sp. L6]NPD84441.1 polyphosphate polymerase domain-containing protein [Lentimicrobium sp. L6]